MTLHEVGAYVMFGITTMFCVGAWILERRDRRDRERGAHDA